MDHVMDHVCAVESLRKTYGSGVVTDRDLSCMDGSLTLGGVPQACLAV